MAFRHYYCSVVATQFPVTLDRHYLLPILSASQSANGSLMNSKAFIAIAVHHTTVAPCQWHAVTTEVSGARLPLRQANRFLALSSEKNPG
jgi:hypothetical protein